MREIDKIRRQIEDSRKDLNDAIAQNRRSENTYKISLRLDELIEKYLDQEEEETLASK